MTFNSSTHATGSAGFIVLTHTVHGSMSTAATQASEALTELVVRHDGIAFEQEFLHVLNGDSIVNGGPPPAGMTVTSNGMFGTLMFSTLQIPIVFGTPEEIKVGLLAEAFQNATNDFSTTATLTGISVVDGLGHPVTDFSITSASGTAYGPNGVEGSPAVPEPGAAWLAGLGLAALGVIGRRLAPPHYSGSSTRR
jgi:hypothetical protein